MLENISQENVLIIKDNIYDSLYDLIINIDNDRCELDLKKITRNMIISVYFKIIQDVYENGSTSDFYVHYKLSKNKEKFLNNILKPSFYTEFIDVVEEYHQHISNADVLQEQKSIFTNVYEEEYGDMLKKKRKDLEDYITESKWEHGLFCLTSKSKVHRII